MDSTAVWYTYLFALARFGVLMSFIVYCGYIPAVDIWEFSFCDPRPPCSCANRTNFFEDPSFQRRSVSVNILYQTTVYAACIYTDTGSLYLRFWFAFEYFPHHLIMSWLSGTLLRKKYYLTEMYVHYYIAKRNSLYNCGSSIFLFIYDIFEAVTKYILISLHILELFCTLIIISVVGNYIFFLLI